MKLYTKDLTRIGYMTHGPYTKYLKGKGVESSRMTRFVCDPATCQLEYILLREILALTGHKITNGDGEDTESGDLAYCTDLPWKDYFKL
jgi:hypothetical protein